MPAPKLPSLEDIIDGRVSLDEVSRLPLPWQAMILEQAKAAHHAALGSLDVPETPTLMAIQNPKHKWMDARHIHFMGDEIADAVYRSKELGESSAILINCPPRHCKPVANTELVLLKSGHRIPLGDVRVGDRVLTHRGRFRRVTDVIERPSEPVLRITTWLGRDVTATPDHPFLTPHGWKYAADLKVGDVLGVPVPEPTSVAGPESGFEARLAGYFVGDGNTSQLQNNTVAANITCFDPAQAEDMRVCADAAGFQMKSSRTRGRYNFSGGIRDWLRTHDLVGTSRTKRVPDFVMQGGKEAARHFLAGYFACDGCVQNRGAQRKKNPRRDFYVEFVSVNKQLLKDCQHLLLRLGVRSRLRQRLRVTNYTDRNGVLVYFLMLSSQDDIDKFRQEVPVKGVKAARLAALDIERQQFDQSIFADHVVAIEDAGVVDCRCLTVEEDHSFTVNDIAVKNSHVVSVWTPFWHLARYPEDNVLLVASEASAAAKWGGKVRRLVELYGDQYGMHLNPKKTAGYDWELMTNGGMICVGAGGTVSGKPAKLLLVDDLLKDDAQARSEIERENMWDWWETTLVQRIEPDTTTAVVGTMYHEDDIYNRILKASANGTGHPFRHISLPAKAIEGELDLLDRNPGEGLWIDHRTSSGVVWGQQYYDRKEASVSPYVWSSVYQQRPTAAGGNMVDPKWWGFYKPSEMPRAFDQSCQSWDISLDAEKKTDSQHAGLVLSRLGALVYIRALFAEHCDINKVIATQRSWNFVYPHARAKLIERATAGVALAQTLRHEIPGIIAWPPKGRQKGSKEAELDACIPSIRAKQVLLPLNSDGTIPADVQKFIDQLRQFPRGAYDDLVDCFSQGMNYLLPGLRSSTRGQDDAHDGALNPVADLTPIEQHTAVLHALINQLAKPKLDALRHHQRSEERAVIPFPHGFDSGRAMYPRRRGSGMW